LPNFILEVTLDLIEDTWIELQRCFGTVYLPVQVLRAGSPPYWRVPLLRPASTDAGRRRSVAQRVPVADLARRCPLPFRVILRFCG